MARSSRLSVCLAMPTRNSSQIHWHRSTSRQRTTPSIAAVGPLSIAALSAARCASLSFGGWPGALRAISPSGPWALNLITQSRTICSAPPRPVIDGGQRQKTARLRRILCTPCNGAQARRIKITPQRDRHGEPPSFATLESDSRRSGNLEASVRSRDAAAEGRRDRDLIEAGLSEPAGWRARLWGLCVWRRLRDAASVEAGDDLGPPIASGGGDYGRQSRAGEVVLPVVA